MCEGYEVDMIKSLTKTLSSHTATHCNALQHTAMHCIHSRRHTVNVLQHTL